MTDLPEPVLNRLCRRKIALNLVGTPIKPANCRHLNGLKFEDRPEETVIYLVEENRQINYHTPETAKELVETFHRLKQEDERSNSARAVIGLNALRRKVEREIPQDSYEQAIEQAKEEMSETHKALLAYAW